MSLEAPIQLRVLIPCVENSIDGLAYRPGDVLRSRKGLTVEIGNTDAEGRLVLADALAEADASGPRLLIDLATLTGAARTALGPELPAAFSTDEQLLAVPRAAPVMPRPIRSGRCRCGRATTMSSQARSQISAMSRPTAFAGSIIAALVPASVL